MAKQGSAEAKHLPTPVLGPRLDQSATAAMMPRNRPARTRRITAASVHAPFTGLQDK